MFLFRLIIDFLKDKNYRAPVISALSVVLTGTLFYHFAEGWRWIDSFYFSVITLATVGYGDFAPATDLGKIFTVVYVLTGIGIIFGFINAFYGHRISKLKELKSKSRKSIIRKTGKQNLPNE